MPYPFLFAIDKPFRAHAVRYRGESRGFLLSIGPFLTCLYRGGEITGKHWRWTSTLRLPGLALSGRIGRV